MNLRGGYNRLFRSADFSNVFVPHIGNPLFGNLSQWVGNGFIFGVCNSLPNPASGPRRRPAVSENVPDRIHERARVSLRDDVRGKFVHSNRLLEAEPVNESNLPVPLSPLAGPCPVLL